MPKPMSTHAALLAGAISLLVSGCSKGAKADPTASMSHPYNVLFLSVDTLRADHMGMYDYERDTTPFLDELAARSTLFEWGLVQWPKTGPSFASMLSSTYSSTNGVLRRNNQFKVPEELHLLPEVLKEAGFETMAVVSNGCLTGELGYHQGFDRWVEHFTIDPDAADQIAEQTKELLRSKKGGNYFLWSHFIDPHTPYHAPDRYVEMFAGDELYRNGPSDPVEVQPEGETEGPPASVGRIPRHAYIDGKNQVRDYVLEYDAEIRYLDDVLRDLFAWMEKEGHLERTIVVFTSDHGESLGDHRYYFEHGRYPYDNCTRVPLFFRVPGAPPARIAEPVALLDLVPTLCEGLGLSAPFHTEGRSLWPWILAGQPTDEALPVITESGYKQDYCVALRQGPWKLIYIGDQPLQKELQGGPYELYNVAEDPLETGNLVEVEEAVFAQMRPRLEHEVKTRYAKKGLAEAIEAGAGTPELRALLEQMGYVDGQ